MRPPCCKQMPHANDATGCLFNLLFGLVPFLPSAAAPKALIWCLAAAMHAVLLFGACGALCPREEHEWPLGPLSVEVSAACTCARRPSGSFSVPGALQGPAVSFLLVHVVCHWGLLHEQE